MKEHNEKNRTFSVAGRQKNWIPKLKFESYISKAATYKFNESHIGNCLKYGYNVSFDKKKHFLQYKLL